MYHIELSFGHCCHDGNPLAASRIATAEQGILQAFAELFRGGRLRREQGSYQTHDGRTIFECCTIASCVTRELGQRVEQELAQVVYSLAQTLEQETVLLTITRIDGQHQWLEPKEL